MSNKTVALILVRKIVVTAAIVGVGVYVMRKIDAKNDYSVDPDA